ncbi:ATP10 protein-domain-containing protein [Powellomyces hirtus]|nr:ATP10 protein-domain-containing protein [Powellomyces hirtus]
MPPKSKEEAEADNATPPTPPPPAPASAGLLKSFAAKLRREVEEMEATRKAKEAASAGPLDTTIPAAAAEDKKKPGFLSGLDDKLQEQRKQLEEAQRIKRELGQSSRVTPKLQKRMDKYLDLDENLKEREDLLKQAFRDGYWDDYKEAARKGAKLWEAPKRIRKAQGSPMIPNPTTKSLTGQTTDVLSLVRGKKATLVTFMFSAFGEAHVNTYTEPFMDAFKEAGDVQLVQLNVEENWLKAPILRLLTPFVRRRVPKERQANYLLHYKSIQDARRAAGMTNTVLGWANLVDAEGRVRWQAHGPAKDHEIESMIRLTRQLAGHVDPAKPVVNIGDTGVSPRPL